MEHRTGKTFVLKVSAGLPQSTQDKEIFHDDWSIRDGWKAEKDEGGHVFYREANPLCRFSEDKLASLRKEGFTADFDWNGTIAYKEKERSPFRSIAEDLLPCAIRPNVSWK